MDEHANNGQAESSVADGREETDEVTAGQAPARLDPAIRVRLLIEAGDFAAARRLLPEIEDAGQVADLRRSLEGRALDQELVRRQMREKMELEHRLELARLRAQMPPEERAAAFPEMGFKQAAAAYARFAGTGPDRS